MCSKGKQSKALPIADKEVIQNKTSATFYNRKLDNRPYIDVHMKDEILPTLIDTGSQVTIIGANLIKNIDKWGMLHPFGATIKMADGSVSIPKGEIMVEYSLEKTTKTIPTVILDHPTRSLIAGMNFINEFGITLVDKEKNEYKTQNQLERLPTESGCIYTASLECNDNTNAKEPINGRKKFTKPNKGRKRKRRGRLKRHF